MATMKLGMAVVSVFVAAAALTAGCGGGAADKTAGKGERITDPARVPSATPMQNPVIYTIKGDTISTTGGSATVVTGNASPTAGIRSYVVVSGDTCSTIATKFGVTVEALIRNNRSINETCSNLAVGDQLRIPGATPVANTPIPGQTARPGATGASSGRTYTVRPGDTCSAIAQNQGVDVQRLIAANNLDANCTRLQVGQVLNIP